MYSIFRISILWLWGSFKPLIFRGLFANPDSIVDKWIRLPWFRPLFLGCLWGALWRSTTPERVLCYASFKHLIMFSVSCKRIQNGTNTQYTLSPLYIIYSTIRNILRNNYNHYHLYCSEKSANIRCFAHWFSFEADSRLIQSNKKVKRQKHQPMNFFASSKRW